MGLYSGGLIIGMIFASEIWGAYFREGLFWGGGGGLLSECYGMLTIPEQSQLTLKEITGGIMKKT